MTTLGFDFDRREFGERRGGAVVSTIKAATQQEHLHISARSLHVLPKPVWVFCEHIFPPTVRLG